MGSPSARPEGRIPPRWQDYFRVQSPVRGHVRHLRPQGRTGCEGWGVASRLPRHGICPRRHGPHGPRNPGSPCTKPHLPGPAELPSSSKLLHPPMDGNGRIKPPAGSTPLPSTPLPSSRSSVANLCKETEKFIVSFFFLDKEFWTRWKYLFRYNRYKRNFYRGNSFLVRDNSIERAWRAISAKSVLFFPPQIENWWVRKGIYWKSSAN